MGSTEVKRPKVKITKRAIKDITKMLKKQEKKNKNKFNTAGQWPHELVEKLLAEQCESFKTNII